MRTRIHFKESSYIVKIPLVQCSWDLIFEDHTILKIIVRAED